MTWLSDLPLLLKGGAIGLAISVPVGPIGVLCIQRTLAGGRILGLVSGLGAATADAIYAAVAALGLVFISEILIGQQPLLRLIGGGVLNFSWATNPTDQTCHRFRARGEIRPAECLRLHFCSYSDQPANHPLCCGNLCRVGSGNHQREVPISSAPCPRGVSWVGSLVVPADGRSIATTRPRHSENDEVGQPGVGDDHCLVRRGRHYRFGRHGQCADHCSV